MRYLKVLKNSIQNVLDQFCPSLSQRWKMMQMFMGSWLLLTNGSQFYFYCQKFKWSPLRNSHRTLYWNIGLLGSIEISIAQASITQVWQIFSPILLRELWVSCRYAKTTFLLSDTSLKIFLMSIGHCGIKHTLVPPFSSLSCHPISQSQYPYTKFPYSPLCFFLCIISSLINHITAPLYSMTVHLWIGPINHPFHCLVPV